MPPAAISVERAGDVVGGAGDLLVERVEEILEHHGDQGFVLDDEDTLRCTT